MTEADLARIPHEEGCESIDRFIHNEPCPFWTKGYCFMEPCVHGVVMKDPCEQCGPGTGATAPDGFVPCHPAPCNCIRAAVITALEDSALLDWLEAQKYGCWGMGPSLMHDGWDKVIETGGNSFGGKTLRAAIRAAKEKDGE